MDATTTADTSRAERERKTWSDRVVQGPFVGAALWRSDAADGPQRFFVLHRGTVHLLPTIEDVSDWLERAGRSLVGRAG